MQKFDTFSKPLQEFQVKTRAGGVLSIVTFVTIFALFVSEIRFYLQIDQKDEMIVDLGQDTKNFSIKFDLWMPDLPCEATGMNLVHAKNLENMMLSKYSITKQRMYAVPKNQKVAEETHKQNQIELEAQGSESSEIASKKIEQLVQQQLENDPGDALFEDSKMNNEYNSDGSTAPRQVNDGLAVKKLGARNVKWNPIGKPIMAGLHKICTATGEFQDALQNIGNSEIPTDHSTRKERCMTCYGTKTDPDVCCNTCESLKQSFRDRGWSTDAGRFKNKIFEQCSDEEFSKNPPQKHEGCMLSAEFESRKVPGILQIGLQHDLRKEHLHQEFLDLAADNYISFSHDIDGLSFGPEFPGYVPVLTGQKKRHDQVPLIEFWGPEKLEPQSEHWQYDLHLIPTDFITPWGTVTESHQYSATYYVKGLNIAQRHRDLMAPGINFKYEFTAFRVRWLQSYKPFSHFLTNICAILGGIYAFFGMIDSLIHQLTQSKTRSGLCL